MLSVLFLSTCEVDAQESYTANINYVYNINLANGSFYASSNSTTESELNTPSFSTLNLSSDNDISIDPDKYYFVSGLLNIHPEVSNASNIQLSIVNFSMYDKNFNALRFDGPTTKTLYNTQNPNVRFVLGVVRGSDILYNNRFNYPFIISGTCVRNPSMQVYQYNFNLFVSGGITIREATESEIANAGTPTSDSGTQQKLDEIQEQNEDAQETRSGIFESIKEFFGSFFDNLIHIFVPEDGFFEEWFDKVLQLLEDKFGFLFTPLDFFIRLIQAIYTADTSESAIPFPEIKWEDTVIISAQNISLSDLWDGKFDDVREKLYFVTDIISIFAFFSLLRKKLSLIIRGNEDDN